MPSLRLASFLLAADCAGSRDVEHAGSAWIVLQHQDAAEAAPILEEVLAPPRCTRDALGKWLPPEPVPVEVDSRRNAVRVQGSDALLAEFRELVRRLDVPCEPSGR